MRGGSATAPVADPSTIDFVSLSGTYKLREITSFMISLVPP